MTRIITLVFFAALVVACDKKDEPAAPTAPAETPTAPAEAPDPAPTTAEAPAAEEGDELPTPEDFEAAAADEIDRANMEKELAKIEEELGEEG
jgi:hypothetical protein